MDGGRRQPGDMMGAWERMCGSCLEQRRRWCRLYEVRRAGVAVVGGGCPPGKSRERQGLGPTAGVGRRQPVPFGHIKLEMVQKWAAGTLRLEHMGSIWA